MTLVTFVFSAVAAGLYVRVLLDVLAPAGVLLGLVLTLVVLASVVPTLVEVSACAVVPVARLVRCLFGEVIPYSLHVVLFVRLLRAVVLGMSASTIRAVNRA